MLTMLLVAAGAPRQGYLAPRAHTPLRAPARRGALQHAAACCSSSHPAQRACACRAQSAAEAPQPNGCARSSIAGLPPPPPAPSPPACRPHLPVPATSTPRLRRAAVFYEAEKHGPNSDREAFQLLEFHEALYWATITLTSGWRPAGSPGGRAATRRACRAGTRPWGLAAPRRERVAQACACAGRSIPRGPAANALLRPCAAAPQPWATATTPPAGG